MLTKETMEIREDEARVWAEKHHNRLIRVLIDEVRKEQAEHEEAIERCLDRDEQLCRLLIIVSG